MSSVDCAWLRMERPTNLITITALLRFDEPLDFERLRSTIEHRLLRFARFRQRLVEGKGRLRLPRWVPDPFFNLDAHLIRTRLRRGDVYELQRLLGDLMGVPLDPTRPLWQMHFVENVEGGCALVCRLHHCIADGVALGKVLLSLTDEEATAATITTLPVDAPEPAARSRLSTAVQAAGSAGRTLARAGRSVLREPGLWARHASSAAGALVRLTLLPADPRSALKGKVGVAKYAAWSHPIPLRDIKAIGHAIGGTVNDVLVSAVSGALRSQLARRQDETVATATEIRAVVPVDLRREGDPPLGNRFGLLFLPLPISIGDPAHRLWELKHRMTRMKKSPDAGVAMGILYAMGAGGMALERVVLSLFARKASLVLTNVPGPQQARYLAGRRIRDLVFWVPQPAGLGLGVSIFSYNGEVRVGVASDARVMPDPETFVADFHHELEALRESVTPLIKRPRPDRLSVPVSLAPGMPPSERHEGVRLSPE
ncbi:MAG TPA: wax ester/triacylglycerol synthase family O-acyltransferase [Myxococcales bacterium]|jgi:WS/DGAT/MGAT family acyltransferase